jgi:hypothetical protein
MPTVEFMGKTDSRSTVLMTAVRRASVINTLQRFTRAFECAHGPLQAETTRKSLYDKVTRSLNRVQTSVRGVLSTKQCQHIVKNRNHVALMKAYTLLVCLAADLCYCCTTTHSLQDSQNSNQ